MSFRVGLFSSGIIKIIGIAIVIGALLTAFYFYLQYNSLRKQMTEKKDEIAVLISTVGKMIELPSKELPTIATVTNTSKLTQEPYKEFFKNAKKGDKVLIFESVQKAILFRPSLNKIIEVGPYYEKDSPPPSISPKKEDEITITILNGTQQTGITKTAQTQLKGKWESISVVKRSDAKGNSYPKSVVFDVTGENTKMTKDIGEMFDANIVTSLPDSESNPDSDVLLILGDNYK